MSSSQENEFWADLDSNGSRSGLVCGAKPWNLRGQRGGALAKSDREMLAKIWDSSLEAAAQTISYTADTDWTVVGFGQQHPASARRRHRSVRYRCAGVSSLRCVRDLFRLDH